jgi:hypothetical protein
MAHMQARMITVVDVALKISHGPMPPNAKAMLSSGRVATRSSRTNSSEETNLPHQIWAEVNSEVSRPARVRCSFSMVIEPVLKMGQRHQQRELRVGKGQKTNHPNRRSLNVGPVALRRCGDVGEGYTGAEDKQVERGKQPTASFTHALPQFLADHRVHGRFSRKASR